MKKITILGSTGSVGVTTLSIILKNLNLFSVKALIGNKNVNLMVKQCKIFKPSYAAMHNKTSAYILSQKLKSMNINTKVFSGRKEICALAALEDVDQVVAAISGSSGLLPILSAIKSGKTILLANKESLIICGHIFMKAVKFYKAKILPIDSEHNAIFQSLPFELQKKIGYVNIKKYGVKNIFLTGSGGPFIKYSINSLKNVTPEQACFHPNWKMGKKISVDSATMINKGFEYIEARLLFNASEKQIKIIIHPQSIIHSMICYIDNSIIAQLAVPDMRIPISQAMSWPKKIISGVKSLDFNKINILNFFKPDFIRYPCLKLAIDAFKEGQSASIILNSANEISVSAFLNKKIKFTDIAKINFKVLNFLSFKEPKNIKEILEIRKETNSFTKKLIFKY